MTLRRLLEDAAKQLQSVSETPALEAEVLAAHCLQLSRTQLFLAMEQTVTPGQAAVFSQKLSRRLHNEPMAYIIGSREFWSLELEVNSDTLIPRPETETLVEAVLARFPNKDEVIQLADLGTGSGAIALALAHERPCWCIDATDVSQSALLIASKNAQRLELKHISFWLGSWCTALPPQKIASGYDVIVSNPPYIAEVEWETYAAGLAYEPRAALTSGVDGLDAIRVIVAEAANWLKLRGYLMIEHGFMQGEAVRKLFNHAGYVDVVTIKDLSGQERVTIGQK